MFVRRCRVTAIEGGANGSAQEKREGEKLNLRSGRGSGDSDVGVSGSAMEHQLSLSPAKDNPSCPCGLSLSIPQFNGL